jgi:hypothetical protein
MQPLALPWAVAELELVRSFSFSLPFLAAGNPARDRSREQSPSSAPKSPPPAPIQQAAARAGRTLRQLEGNRHEHARRPARDPSGHPN